MQLLARTLTSSSILAPYSTWAARIGQDLPLDLPGRLLELAAHEWPLCDEWRGLLHPHYRPLKGPLSGYHGGLQMTLSGLSEHITVRAANEPLMPVVRPNSQSLALLSIALSIVSAALSLFFYFGTSKPFIILTSAAPTSIFAGLIATATIAFESLRLRAVSATSLGAFALAVATYTFANYVIRDYASDYSILQ